MSKGIEDSLSQILPRQGSGIMERRTVLKLSLFGLMALFAPISARKVTRIDDDIVIVDGWIVVPQDLNR